MQNIPDIAPVRKRLEEIDALMAQPEFYQDSRRAAEISREHQKIQRMLTLYEECEALEGDVGEHSAILEDPDGDEDLKILAGEELPQILEKLEQSRKNLLAAMIPPDRDDSRNTVVEIRAGAGGDEASLFAADLYRMYSRLAEIRGWKVEHLGGSLSETGGFKQVVCLISGHDVYRSLKFESGVHRVQRVPVTEANGRIHTSTATVAVLPEAAEVDVRIDPADLEITVSRARGPGGQGVNTTDSAVQILHKPSGFTIYCADERSQLKNKNKALKVLRARLLKQKEEEEREKYAAHRRDQIGTGDRSERIRTYNFPQSRLTDHRIGLTLHSLPQVLEGELETLIEALRDADDREKLEALIKDAAHADAPRGP